MNYFRDLTDDECKIYDSWISKESIKTGENLFNVSKPKTNGDRIRHMTDEELAAEFPHDICSGISGVDCREFDLPCYECRVAWLKHEVSEDD